MRLGLYLMAAVALRADFDPKQWSERQPIRAEGPAARVALDAAVYAGAQDSLADLRIVNANGQEIPYVLSVAQATTRTQAVPVRLTNREQRNGALTATLEFDGKQLHNRLTLVVTREDFRSKIRVEASDDGRAWATVRSAAYVFRYRADDGRTAEHLTVQYPDSRRRLLRLTLEEWPDAAQLTGVEVERTASHEARRSLLWQGTPVLAVDAPKKTSCYLLDTRTRAPRDRITMRAAAAPAEFHRSVTLEESRDGKRWTWLAAGALYRTASDDSRVLEFAETSAPWQRLCIFQGDDAPVRLEAIQVEGVNREVTFRTAANTPHRLYYGNAKASAPVYDLARTAGEELTRSAIAGALGAREANPLFQAPPPPVVPWSERYPGVLYGTLAIAVAGLGWMALRLLRSA